LKKELAGNFVGVGDGIDNAEGAAKVVYLDGSDVLWLEYLKVTNGPVEMYTSQPTRGVGVH
jgi:hypothetical protein